jgi:hypothetical protein
MVIFLKTPFYFYDLNNQIYTMNFFLKIIVSGSMLLMIISAASANKVK